MLRAHKSTCLAMLCMVLPAGCGPDQNVTGQLAAAGFQLYCGVLSQSLPLPERFPPELAVVMSDPKRFSPESHSLRNAAFGTVLDEPSKLNGCWGRFSRETIATEEAGAQFAIESFSIMRINLSLGEVSEARYGPPVSILEAGPSAPLVNAVNPFNGDRPTILTARWRFIETGPNAFELALLDSRGAAVLEDGSLGFHCPASFGVFDDYLHDRFIVQGDHLKLYETYDETFFETADPEGFSTLWVRFDCPTE